MLADTKQEGGGERENRLGNSAGKRRANTSCSGEMHRDIPARERMHRLLAMAFFPSLALLARKDESGREYCNHLL